MNITARPTASIRSAPLFDPPTVLVFGSSLAALDRATAAVTASGQRLAAALPIGDAINRLDLQASASAVWVELDEDEGDALDRLLDRVDRDAAAGRYAAIVAARATLLDPVEARLSRGAVDLLVDPSLIDRTAALAVALSGARRSAGARLSDIASDNSAARLRLASEPKTVGLP